MTNNQLLRNNGLVYVQGYEFLISNLRICNVNGVPAARFTGTCTANPRNDSIRNTGYNGGTYGGSRMVYDWQE